MSCNEAICAYKTTGDAVFGELQSFLTRRGPDFSHDAPPLFIALSVAAEIVGESVDERNCAEQGDSVLETLRRMSAGANILLREIDLAAGATGDFPAPVIAVRSEDRAPVVLVRNRGRWRTASAETAWVLRRSDAITGVDDRAYLLTPALPDQSTSAAKLIGFGFRQGRGDIGAILLMALLSGLAAASIPLMSGLVVEDVVPSRDIDLLLQVAVLLCLAFGASVLTRMAGMLSKIRFEGRMCSMLRATAIDRMLRLLDKPDGPHLPPPIATLTVHALDGWYRGVWNIIIATATSIVFAVPSFAVMLHASAVGGVIVMLVFALALVLATFIVRRRLQAITGARSSQTSWMVTAHECFSMIDTLRSAAAERRMFSRWTVSFLKSRRRFLKADRIGAGSEALNAGFEAALMAAALFTLMLVKSDVDAYTAMFILSVSNVAGAMVTLLNSLGDVGMLGVQRRLLAPLLEGAPRPRVRGRAPSRLSGDIRLSQVSYRYHPTGPLVFSDIDIHVAPGEHIGIAGHSGAGKTTLSNIILGILEPSTGQVLFDGMDMRVLDPSALRRQIGVVGHDGRLFAGTLFSNVAVGEHAGRADVEHALELAGFGEDLRALPLGLATPISDTDAGFSGGQVQRILLARAFINRPRLMVLDEATSALDEPVQAHVARSIDAMKCSVITIAHRLETLRHCDRIYVLEAGQIVETGSFEALAQAHGLFSRMLAAGVGGG